MEYLNCICCGSKITPLWVDNTKYNNPEDGSWNGGVVEKIYPGYGSKFDSDAFVIGICDSCIEEKLTDGVIMKKVKLI